MHRSGGNAAPSIVVVLLALVSAASLAALPPAGTPGSTPLRPVQESDHVSPPDRTIRVPAPEPTGPMALPRARFGSREPVAREILVRFRAGESGSDPGRLARELGGEGYIPARFAPFGRVPVPDGTSPATVLTRFRASDRVLWAERDGWVRALLRQISPAVTFNDPLLDEQWHWDRIELLEAFDRNGPRGSGVVVAVVDSGVAFGNGATFPSRPVPDLAGVSIAPGFDFVDPGTPPFDEGTRLDPDDPDAPRFGHGSYAASLIAARAGNNLAGIGAAPRVTIMALRVLGQSGFGRFSDVAEAISFATERGADVVNLSLGADQGSAAIRDAVDRARAAGVLVVAAAGNEAEDPDFAGDVAFPARDPGVLAVGATDFFDEPAAYSNFGPHLDLMAPAGDDLEFVTPSIRDATLATSFVHDPVSGDTLYGAFWATGTSFAAPQVAAAAALLESLGVTDPEALEFMLLHTTRDLRSQGFDERTGNGLLDTLGAHRGVGF